MKNIALFPEFKDNIWGGTKLKDIYGKKTDKEIVAESWELSYHKDGVTKTEDGTPLPEVLTRADIGFNCDNFSFFPVLIKFIDAREYLSVQVHPSDSYALKEENSFGKTEMWYIVEADEGAGIYLGFKNNVTHEQYVNAINNGTLTELLNFYKVKAGDCFFIPSGTIHAIGPGCLICEIQQNSNLTYRVYDYGRKDKNGNERELHVEKGLEVLKIFDEAHIDAIRYSHAGAKRRADSLADCEYFSLSRVSATPDGVSLPYEHQGSMRHLLCIGGEGELLCGGDIYPVSRGASYLIPACLGDLTLRGSAVALVSVGKN